MVCALIKDFVMSQMATVFVMRDLKESLVKVICKRLKFYHYKKQMPKYDTFLDKSCPGDGLCSNQGVCNVSNGNCICDAGFEGITCEGNL